MAGMARGLIRTSAVIVLVILAVPLLLLAADNRRSILLGLSGDVHQGVKFGVAVGEPMSTAAGKLLKLSGVEFYERRNGGLCLFRKFPEGHQIDIYGDHSWRKGAICLVGRNGRVVEIIWMYEFVSGYP